MTTFTSPDQVPADVSYLADGNDVLFARDEDEFDSWVMQPPMPGFALPLVLAFARFGNLREVDNICERCDEKPGETCCSSHGKHLCHGCYRRTHFVEVCVEGCSACGREGLPVLLARRGAA